MNKAQEYLLDNRLADRVLLKAGEKLVYASDAMMGYASELPDCEKLRDIWDGMSEEERQIVKEFLGKLS